MQELNIRMQPKECNIEKCFWLQATALFRINVEACEINYKLYEKTENSHKTQLSKKL